MQKRTVTFVAIGGLIAAVVAAFLMQRVPLGSALDGKAAEKAVDKAGDAKVGSAGAPQKAADKAGKGFGPAPVEVVDLKPGRVEEELLAVGTLRSNESVILRPEVAGRIASIGFRDGQAVKKGQLLIGLDASLNEAEVAQARAELELARANLKRTEDLASKNFVSGSAQDQAASNVQVLDAKLKLSEVRLNKMRIVAPFDGVVGIRNVSVGEYVKDGADLVNVEDVRQLKVDFRLPERYLVQLKVGAPVEVIADALPGARYRGVVDAVNPRVEPNGRSLEVRARLDNTDGRLRPGMFARVRVILGTRPDALLVPEEAIVPLGDDFFVYTVVNDTARRIKVKLGVRRDAQVELLDGVKAGDKVVTAGVRIQRDGQSVRIVASAAAGLQEAKKAETAPETKGESKVETGSDAKGGSKG